MDSCNQCDEALAVFLVNFRFEKGYRLYYLYNVNEICLYLAKVMDHCKEDIHLEIRTRSTDRLLRIDAFNP